MTKITFSKTDVIEHAWELTKQHFWFVLGLTIVTFFISAIPGFFGEQNQYEGFVLIASILAWVAQIFLSIGLVNIVIKLARNESADWNDLWTKRHLFWRFLGGSLLYALIVFAGFILLVLPGIYWSVKYQFFSYFMIDKELGIRDSLRKSAEVTKGHIGNLFIFNLILSLIVFLGILALLVGMFVAIPLTWLATAVLYLKLSEDIPHLTISETQEPQPENTNGA